MTPVSAIQGSYASVRSILNSVNSLLKLNISVAVNTAIADILEKTVATQRGLSETEQMYTASLKKIDDLEQEIVRLKAWDGEAERYELKHYHPGTLAYALKPAMANGEPFHHLCAKCYSNGIKTILQAEAVNRPGNLRHFVCNPCKSAIPIGGEMPA